MMSNLGCKLIATSRKPAVSVLAMVFSALLLSACESNDNDDGYDMGGSESVSSPSSSLSSSSSSLSSLSSSSLSSSSSSLSNESSSSSSSSSNSSSLSSSSSSNSSASAAFAQADGIKGGQLYSKFWADETDFDLANSNLTTQAQLDNIDSNADFFRCKHCHGWDRLGREGGYSDRGPSASRPSVAPVNLALISEMNTPEDLFAVIKSGSARRDIDTDIAAADAVVRDRMPDFGQILTDEQIWDIVKYLKEEAIDTTELYTLTLGAQAYPDRSHTFTELGLDGDAANGDAIFAASCAACHGADGTMILVDGGEYTIGRHVRAKPYEDQHKVKFGNLGSAMGPVLRDASVDDIKDLLKALADTTKYPDAQAPALDGAQLYASNCAGCHGPLATSPKQGATAQTITNAINGGIAPMAGLSGLTDEEISAIAEALAQ